MIEQLLGISTSFLHLLFDVFSKNDELINLHTRHHNKSLIITILRRGTHNLLLQIQVYHVDEGINFAMSFVVV
jgi:hypothetical protein